MASEAQLLQRLRKICLALPEATEGKSFDQPVWKAGKKTFCALEPRRDRWWICLRVEPEEQAILVEEQRFEIAPYVGQHGWVHLDASGQVDWEEAEELILASYRHFALKRMLRELDG